MLSQIPIKLEKLSREKLDMELLRVGMIAELDAVNLYEQLAAATDNDDLKKVEELEKGKEEVEELTS